MFFKRIEMKKRELICGVIFIYFIFNFLYFLFNLSSHIVGALPSCTFHQKVRVIKTLKIVKVIVIMIMIYMIVNNDDMSSQFIHVFLAVET